MYKLYYYILTFFLIFNTLPKKLLSEDPSNYAFKVMDLSKVNNLYIHSFKVIIQLCSEQNNEEGIAIEAADENQKNISITLEGNKLTCSNNKKSKSNTHNEKKPILYIYIKSPMQLYKISLSGASSLEIKAGTLNFPKAVKVLLSGFSHLVLPKIITDSLVVNAKDFSSVYLVEPQVKEQCSITMQDCAYVKLLKGKVNILELDPY